MINRVIDLCLDMPPSEEYYCSMLHTFILNPSYAGYKNGYGRQLASEIGLTLECLEATAAAGGESALMDLIRSAARDKVTPLDEWVAHLNRIGVKWGITVSHSHSTEETARIVRQYPDKFKGFIFVDPNRGFKAVQEFETAVREYGLHALYVTPFRTKLPVDHRLCYPLYAKACELGVPVHFYCSVNLSKSVPYDIAHPGHIDQVARDFPELRIMAGVAGFPWVYEFMAVAMRHEKVYLNFETNSADKFDRQGSGFEPYLYYGEGRLQDKICFATNWTVQCTPVEELIARVEALPFSDTAKAKILYENAERFYHELS